VCFAKVRQEVVGFGIFSPFVISIDQLEVEMTNPIGRTIAALVAAFVVWTVVRAFRQGVIYDNIYSFSLDESPMLFSIAVISHMLGAAFLLSVAAGYDQATFLHWVLGR
jgi:hypothetical protein